MFGEVEVAHVVEANCCKTTNELCMDYKQHKKPVLAILPQCNEDSKGHRRIEMAARDVAKYDDRSHEREGDRSIVVLIEDCKYEQHRADAFKQTNCKDAVVTFCLH